MSSKGNKARILLVLRILEKHSDRNNPISAEVIMDYLSDEGVVCERKALYDDIGILRELGYDVRTVRGDRKGYILASRDFEPTEVSLIFDAVKSSGFIPSGKIKSLTDRLLNLVSIKQAQHIKSNIGIVNSTNNLDDGIYTKISLINDAISGGRKLWLNYRRNGLAGRRLEFTYKEMTVSPYAILRDNEHYYLICNNEKYDNLMNLRVDRIDSIKITEKPTRHFSEVSEYNQRFDTADYAKKAFNMFGGEVCRIDLECDVKLLDQIVEKFGTDIFIRRDEGSNKFRFMTDALISDGLIGWIMQFGGDIRVLSPKELKTDVLNRAEKLFLSCKL